MRMRKRHNLAPRMEKCADLMIGEPMEKKGRWLADFPGRTALYVELGCGKGRFTAGTAEAMPEALLVAVEKVPDAMIVAMERVRDAGLENVRFLDMDAEQLGMVFAPGEIDRLYINFCDPWPKSRDAKLRLTAPGFLRLYADALADGGQIHFKTDNTPLFDWSAEQLCAEGWALSELTHDLHEHGPVGVMTDYEAKFTAEGMKINRLVATKTAATLGTAAGPVPRLRGASLVDARGIAQSQADSEGRALSAETPEGSLSLAEESLPLFHAFYQRLEQDPALFSEGEAFRPYTYDPAETDALFARQQRRSDREGFLILLNGEVIGNLYRKRIDPEQKSCELGVCLVNDRYKDRGYGSRAIRLALDDCFEHKGMETVFAEVLRGNARSRHVLEKLGFRLLAEDGDFLRYGISRKD